MTYGSILALVTPDWLLEATDGARLRSVLEAADPAFGFPGLTITSCKVKLRVLDADGRWWGSVKLELGPTDDDESSTRKLALAASFLPPGLRHPGPQRVQGKLGDRDWSCSMPELGLELTAIAEDPKLPARALLIDGEQARPLLQDSIRAARAAWRTVEVNTCQPEVTRYKPGSRCTVRYRLTYRDGSTAEIPPGEEPPGLVVAKTYRSGAGMHTFAAMSGLWRSPLATSSTVRIAEPLAYHPAIDVLVQGPVPQETTLKALIGRVVADGDQHDLPRLRGLLVRTATALGELHRCGLSDGPERVWQDELAVVDDCLRRLTNAIPPVAGLGRPQLNHVAALFADHPLDHSVPSHGGFRAAQVLVAADDIGIIDFDDFCLADPAMDLAEFARFLVQEGFGEPADPHDADGQLRLALLDDLVELVVDTYAATNTVDRERLVGWLTLGWLNRLLGGWAKGKTDRLAIDARLLDYFLEQNGIDPSPFASSGP